MPEPTSTISAILTAAALKKLVENVVTDIYKASCEQYEVQAKKWKSKSHFPKIGRQVLHLRQVKTILQAERAVDLLEFYYPAKVQFKQQRAEVHQVSDFGEEQGVIIEGDAGQGKSIFLRYLASNEFERGYKIPVFLELRKVREPISLLKLILQELKVLGFEMNEALFEFLAGKAKVTLLLDAFDEVKAEIRTELLSQIEDLMRQHPNLKVVVTSRPESGIATSARFRVHRICKLEGNEYQGVIRKITYDASVADTIVRGIKRDTGRLVRLLDTPLMVALLIVRFRIDQSLPQNTIAFFDGLFEMLLRRHDNSKGGYVRPRKAGLGDSDLFNFFNILCYLTARKGETSFRTSVLVDHSKEALNLLEKDADPKEAVDDIAGVTCLIVKDGEEYKFVHKSVQDYHSALFISKQPEQAANKFYEKMQGRWYSWREQLFFLKSLDTYRFYNRFHIPELERMLGIKQDPPYDKFDIALREFGDDTVTIYDNESGSVSTGKKSWPLTFHQIEGYGSEAFHVALGLSIAKRERNLPEAYKVRELLSTNGHSELRNILVGVIEGLHVELQNANEWVSSMSDREALFDL